MPTKAELSRRSKNAVTLYAAACLADMLGEEKLHQELTTLAEAVKSGERVPNA
jgi:predicted protein tyrosine phosphatase